MGEFRLFAVKIKDIIGRAGEAFKNGDVSKAQAAINEGLMEVKKEAKVAKEKFEEAAKTAQEYADYLSEKAAELKKEAEKFRDEPSAGKGDKAAAQDQKAKN